MGKQKPPAVMEVSEMKDLISEDAEVILRVLNNTQRGFQGFLRKRRYNGKDIEITLQLIVKACKSRNEGSVHKLLHMLCEHEETFLSNDIFKIISEILEKDYQINPSHFLNDYVIILKHLLKKQQKQDFVSEVLPRLDNYINDLSVTNKDVQTIKKELKAINEEIKRQEQPCEELTVDFRSISIFPKATDMKNINPSLQPNMIDGAYKSVDHYLDVQFRLMREDMIRSFRTSIEEVKNSHTTTFRSSSSRPEVAAMFKNIKISDRPQYHTDGVRYKITFGYGDTMSKNNPFIPGSIVCLSCDKFEDSFIFATIRTQDTKNKLCIISVVIETGDSEILLDNKYDLIVTNAYFESYRNVLSALQGLDKTNFPLSDYIVKLDSSDSSPAYDDTDTMFCLHELCDYKGDLDDDDHSCKVFDVLVGEEWPTEEALKLDAHQRTAFQAALTQKLAIIQGPPGTGKTFLGIKIVKALLENLDKKPIVICCQTNHALDQFLNHILKHTQKVLRLGMQSQDEGMKQRSLPILGNAIKEYREIKLLHLDIPDEIRESLEIIEHFVPNIDEWGKPKSFVDYTEIELRKLCPVLNDMLEEYLNLKFNKYMEPTLLMQYLPASIIEAKERDPNQSVKTLKHFMATWLDVDDIGDIYKMCENSWKGFNDDVLKEAENFEKYGSKNIWAISLQKRYNYLYSWRMKKMKELEKYISEKRDYYFELLDKFKDNRERQLINLDWLEMAKAADIIGATMTGAGKYKHFFQLLKPQIMVVEEAAETLECNVISSLVSTINQLILIGDHEQLRPLPADDELSKKYNLSISLFERLVRNNIPHATLTTQHRMRPCISDLLVPHIYKELKCHPSVEAFESIKSIQHDLFFFNHDVPEDMRKGTSITNSYEASFIAKLAAFLVGIGYEGHQITILAMYAAQIVLIQELLKKDDLNILVTTVDGYQGEENDIILLSLVRSNRNDSIGFLYESNRLCVALSRARKGLYCIGNFNLLAKKSEFWANVIEKVKRSGQIGEQFPIQCPCHQNKIPVVSVKDFDDILDEGCKEICGFQLPCKHYCPSLCHFYDVKHDSAKCRQPCNKTIKVQRKNKMKERLCKRQCYQPCEDSKSLIKLPCGHQKATNLNSTGNIALENCIVEMTKQLACGHLDQVPCSVAVADHKCRALVPITLKCGHLKKLPCYQNRETEQTICNEQKPYSSICGHTVFVPCYITPTEDVLLEYCKNSCSMLLKCGHPCLNPCNWCYSIKIHSNCGVPCDRKLYCGHLCQGCCASPCCECDLKCELGCEHNTCVNPCNKPCVECKLACSRECVHQKCSNLCYQECSVPPCDKPCEKKLVCGHKCIGLCGDPCPPLCRVCNKKDLKSSNVDKDRFVYLNNSCRHTLEVKKLTSWVGDRLTLLPNCLQCGATITRNLRYKDDVIRAKKNFVQCADSRYEMLDIVTYEFHTFCGIDNVPTHHFLGLQKKLEDILTGKPSIDMLARLPVIMFCLRELYNWRIKTETDANVENRFEILVTWLYNNLETASYQQLQELKESVILLKMH